jgi:hypothetical protein
MENGGITIWQVTGFVQEQNMVVHYYKPITIESLNFVLVQLNQTNEDPSIPTFSCLSFGW